MMRSLFRIAALTAVAPVAVLAAPEDAPVNPAYAGKEQPSSAPIPNNSVVQGCFSSSGELKFDSTDKFMTLGVCGNDICQHKGFKVGATTNGTDCWCGNKYPPKDSLAEDKECNSYCRGFGQDACGGEGFWTVYNTGLDLVNVKFSDPEPKSTSTASTSTAASTTASTPTQSATQASATSAPSKSSKPNVGGIAAGVVVGVVAITGIACGIFFFMKRRRNQEIEDEHRRNMAVSQFVQGHKSPNGSGYSISDSRMDPVMANRRMSDGSIADNQDYSRKILRVTNA